MATSTSNLKLTLPSVNDAADIAVLNSNFQKIDGKIPAEGAAPAGYGLGGITTHATADEATKTGFYHVWLENVCGYTGYVNLMVINRGDEIINQIAYGVNKAAMRRTYYNGWSAWENIGPSAFAPSGYGLGTYAQLLTADHNLNNPLPTGLYRWGSSVPVNAPSPIGYAVMLHIARTDGDSIQKVWHLGTHSGVQISCERYLSDNKGEWEWTNPPMQVGVEYRTTERWQGKAVYTMLVYCGAGAVAGGYKTVSTSIARAAKTVRYHVDITNSSGNKLGNPPLEYADGSVLGRITISASNDITMMCYKDLSATDTYCQLWYTKD